MEAELAVREIIALLLAGVFLVAGGTKLVDPSSTRRTVRDIGLPSVLGWPIALALPPMEIVLAIGLLFPSTTRAAGAAAAGLLAVFALILGVNALRGRKVDCNCFGGLHSGQIGAATVIRNVSLAAGAVVVALTPPHPISWVSVVATLGIVALGVQAALWIALVRRHGRALARIAELEAGAPSAGLTPGTKAPHFALAATNGARIALADLLEAGKPVLLAFVDARCGPCQALLPDLARWQRELVEELTVAVVATGEPAAVQTMVEAAGASVLMSPDGAVARDYATEATPSAVVVSADGRIASSLRYAAGGVGALVTELTGELGAPIHA
ncbi:MAG: MauE/DoxX family redox-associated membrane protein [Gaiella sp.]